MASAATVASAATPESRDAVAASLAAASSPRARDSVRATKAPLNRAAAFRVSSAADANAALATEAATAQWRSSKAARARRNEMFSRATRSWTSAGGAGRAQLAAAQSYLRSYESKNAFRVRSRGGFRRPYVSVVASSSPPKHSAANSSMAKGAT